MNKMIKCEICGAMYDEGRYCFACDLQEAAKQKDAALKVVEKKPKRKSRAKNK